MMHVSCEQEWVEDLTQALMLYWIYWTSWGRDKTRGPIKDKFYVEPLWVGGTKVCLLHLGHMTKMAATPIYGKNPSKIFFPGTGEPISTKLGM